VTPVRTLISSLAVAAVAAIAIVAAIDTFRGSSEEAAAQPPAPAEPIPEPALEEDPASFLRARGASGTLVFTDAACRTASLSLPELLPARVTAAAGCPEHRRGDGWIAVGDLKMVALPGCTAGSGTPAPRCHGAALTTEDVYDALRPAGAVTIVEAAWLGEARLAAIVRDESQGLDLVAVFERRQLVAPPSLADPHLSGLSVSPRRRHVAVQSSAGGVYVLDREGRLALPGRYRFQLLETRAVAWSPDDAWTALATRGGIYLLETGRATRHVVDLPISAQALEWR
jgi:hypothetical protein